MPKQEIGGEELFNLALSIVGLILRDGSQSLKDLSEHFGFSEKAIKKAVLTIANSEDIGNFRTHFYLDDESLDQGMVNFSQAAADLSEPPLLSKRQATALATGLDFLASLPQFSANSELKNLRQSLGSDTPVVVQAMPRDREASLLSQLQTALLEERSIECEYVNQLGERGVRKVDPLRIDFISDKRYLRGFCHKNQEVRSFRVDRILSLEITSEPISKKARNSPIPEEVFGTKSQETVVLISAKPEAAEIFWNFPSFNEIRREGEELVGEIMVGSLKALGRHIARYGGLVRVMEPEQAKEAVRNFAQNALSNSLPKDED